MNIKYLKSMLQVLLPVLDKVLILGIYNHCEKKEKQKQRYTREGEGEGSKQYNIKAQANVGKNYIKPRRESLFDVTHHFRLLLA